MQLHRLHELLLGALALRDVDVHHNHAPAAGLALNHKQPAVANEHPFSRRAISLVLGDTCSQPSRFCANSIREAVKPDGTAKEAGISHTLPQNVSTGPG